MCMSVEAASMLFYIYTVANKVRRVPVDDTMRRARETHYYLRRAWGRKVVGPHTVGKRMGGPPELRK